MMELTLLCLASAMVLGSLATAKGAGENLLPNGSFEILDEKTGLPIDWRQSEGKAITLGTRDPREGKRYVHLVDDNPKDGLSVESKHLPCEAGDEYSATAWVRFTDNCQPGLYLQFHDDSGQRFAEQHVRAPGPCPEWTRMEVKMEAPEDSHEVSVLLYGFGADVGEFDFDEVSLTVKPAPESQKKRLPVATVAQGAKKPPVEIGDRLQLFVDSYLTDTFAGASLALHSPLPREIAFHFDEPWEGPTSAYVSIIKDGDLYRAYYRGSGHEGPTYREATCYAESRDGIVWTKPKLGLFESNGSKENNIVWIGSGTHNFTPFLDTNPAAKPEDRYKALAGGPLIALSSPDGLHWKKMQEDPVITKGAFDSQNVAFWDPTRGRYAAYFRGFRDGVRAIMYATSQDFLHWTDSDWVDLGDSKKEHLYTNATTPYFRAPEILMSFPMRYVEGRQWDPKHVAPGLCDAVYMTSRDGVHFDRTFMEAFVRPGLDPENWTERNLWTAYGVVPTSPTEVSLYYGEHFRHATLRLRRATLRPDGFVSVHAGYSGGEILTRPMRFSGKELIINFSTSAAGSVRIELQDESGHPLPGYTMLECPPIYGDELERVVRWRGGSDLSAVAGKSLRLRVRLKDADLYSFRFRKAE